jgi:hypothetical protein
VLNWVGRPAGGGDPLAFEARLYDTLFQVRSFHASMRGS